MSTKIFLSWSGNLSQKVAAILKSWLPKVIQEVDPFFSKTDIRKGSGSIETIFENMSNSRLGISCITMSNKEKPWIEYEAGFLSGMKVPVCAFLINAKTDDVKLPISHFQLTIFEKEDVYQLVKEINEVCSNKLSEQHLRSSFEANWTELHKSILDVINSKETQIEERQERRIFNEDDIRTIVRQETEGFARTVTITLAEYNALKEKRSDTLYLITDDD